MPFRFQDAPLPPVYIVSLERRAHLREPLAASLAEAGFDTINWIPAVDGKAELDAKPPWKVATAEDAHPVAVNPWKGWIDPYSRRAMTLGEVGCTISHARLWRAVMEGGVPALALEEDVTLGANAAAWTQRVLGDLGAYDWDVCYMAHRNDGQREALQGRYIASLSTHALWTLAYLVSPEGAKRLYQSPWNTHLIPSDEVIPGIFGVNNDAGVNKTYTNPHARGFVTTQRTFHPLENTFTDSSTEKSVPVRDGGNALSVFTVASDANDALRRLQGTAARYGYAMTTLGLGRPWKGGDMSGPGGGQKINLLRPELRSLPDDAMALFVDGYDVVLSGHERDLMAYWRKAGSPSILFAAETTCWPDAGLAYQYPEVAGPYRFLNSGVFMGRVDALRKLVADPIADEADDQLYYTERFLSGEHGIALDTKCLVFQCLNHALEDVGIDEGRGMAFNKRFDTWPAVIHANGPSKAWLEGDGRSIGGRWRRHYGEMDAYPEVAQEEAQGAKGSSTKVAKKTKVRR